MKQLFYLVVIIVLPIILFFQYQNWRRFHPPSTYEYTINEEVDTDYFDPQVVQNYYTAALEAGNYARYCWAEHDIDVRHADLSDPEEAKHVKRYQQHLSSAQYLEGKLLRSTKLKRQGYTQEEIQKIVETGQTPAEMLAERLKNVELYAVKGSRNALVFEIQRILKEQGYQLPVDGIYRDSTEMCVRMFQEKNELYPSGVIDQQTLIQLLTNQQP